MSADVVTLLGGAVVSPAPAAAKRPRRSKRPTVARLPCARLRLALEASWQLDAIAETLLAPMPENAGEDDFRRTTVHRLFATRMRELASVLMSITCEEDGRETAEMHEVVHGVRPREAK